MERWYHGDFGGAAKAAPARGASKDHAWPCAGRSAHETRERRETQAKIDLGKRASTKRGGALENAGPKAWAAKNKVASVEELISARRASLGEQTRGYRVSRRMVAARRLPSSPRRSISLTGPFPAPPTGPSSPPGAR